MKSNKKTDYSALIILAFIFPGGLTFIFASISYGIVWGILGGPIFWGIVWFLGFKNKN